MFVSRNLNIIKNVLSPCDLLTVEIVMHLFILSDEENGGSLPGSSDVSPRNAPSVHRIVNRCVSITTLNVLSVHRIVNRCVSIETLNVLSGHRIVNSSVSIATPNVPSVHRIVNRCVSIATPNVPSVQRVTDRCVPAETNKKMTLVVNPRSTNWTLVLVLSCDSLLCMLPEEVKSSYQMADSGYDTYLRDAHRQVKKSVHSTFYVLYEEINWRPFVLFVGPLTPLILSSDDVRFGFKVRPRCSGKSISEPPEPWTLCTMLFVL